MDLRSLGLPPHGLPSQLGQNQSVYWAATDAGHLLKQRNGTQIDEQTHDLEAMLRVFEIKQREVDHELSQFMKVLLLKPNEQSTCWRRRCLREVFHRDASKCSS